MATMGIVYQEEMKNSRRDLCFICAVQSAVIPDPNKKISIQAASCDWLTCDECGDSITNRAIYHLTPNPD